MAVTYDVDTFLGELVREYESSGVADVATVMRALSRVIPFLDPGERREYDNNRHCFVGKYRYPGQRLEPVSPDEAREHAEHLCSVLAKDGKIKPGAEQRLRSLAAFGRIETATVIRTRRPPQSPLEYMIEHQQAYRDALAEDAERTAALANVLKRRETK